MSDPEFQLDVQSPSAAISEIATGMSDLRDALKAMTELAQGIARVANEPSHRAGLTADPAGMISVSPFFRPDARGWGANAREMSGFGLSPGLLVGGHVE